MQCDYTPRHRPADSIPAVASHTITAGQLVAASGSGTVRPTEAATVSTVGVAATDAAVGERLHYFTGGVQRLIASGGITAGQPVIAGLDGTVVAHATPPAGQMVGVALTTALDTA